MFIAAAFSALATGTLIFLILRRASTSLILIIALAAIVGWLMVGVGWATNQIDIDLNMQAVDLKFPLLATLLTVAVIYIAKRGGKQSMQTVAVVMGAMWLAVGMGWGAGQWSGILAITMPSLIILVIGMLALPPFVLPVNPLPWKGPAVGASLYTVIWWGSEWFGLLEMNAISLLAYLQGFFLIFRPAIPIENVNPLIARGLLASYGFIAVLIWRPLSGFELNNALNLLVLVQGILVLSCYMLPLTNEGKRGVWGLAFPYGLAALFFVFAGGIDFNPTNMTILLLGLLAFLRFALPNPDDTDKWGRFVDKHFDRFPDWRLIKASHQPARDPNVVAAAVLGTVYLLVWSFGFPSDELAFPWLILLIFAIGLAAVTLPALVKPSDNWKTFKAIITYNLGRNYTYYAVKGNAGESGRLTKRVEGNRFRKILAGPGITLSNADHAFVVWDGTGKVPERVLPPGVGFTHTSEDVQEIVDLRYQLRSEPPVSVKTKDGIDVNVAAFMPFRLAIPRAAAVAPYGYQAILAQYDGTIEVWRLDVEVPENRRLARTLVGHKDWARALAITPNGTHAVSTSSDGTLKIWELKKGNLTVEHALEGFRRVRSIATSLKRRRVILGSSDGTVQVFNPQTGKEISNPDAQKAHKDWVCAVAVAEDIPLAVSMSSDKTLKTWNIQTGKELRSLDTGEDWVNAIAITPDGSRVIAATPDSSLKVWDLVNYRQERTLEAHPVNARAMAVATSKEGPLTLVAIMADGTVCEWDIDTGKKTSSHNPSPELQVAISDPRPELGRSYPHDEEAILKAVRAQQLTERDKGSRSGWDELVHQRCNTVLRDIISGYSADELCFPLDLSVNPRGEITSRMTDAVQTQIRNYGLELTGCGIGNLIPPDEVKRQRIANWQAKLRKEMQILEAQAEAQERKMIKRAQAHAEKEVIARIREVLTQLKKLKPERRKELIALRLLAAIEQPETNSGPSTPEPSADTETTLEENGMATWGQSDAGGGK